MGIPRAGSPLMAGLVRTIPPFPYPAEVCGLTRGERLITNALIRKPCAEAQRLASKPREELLSVRCTTRRSAKNAKVPRAILPVCVMAGVTQHRVFLWDIECISWGARRVSKGGATLLP